MFRCPTCIAVLVEPRARRCATCGQNLRRRQPLVLGDASRVSSIHLPIDRVLADSAARKLAPAMFEPTSSPVAPRVTSTPVLLPMPAPMAEPEPVLAPAAAVPASAPEPEPLILPLVARSHTATNAASNAATAPAMEPEPTAEPEPDVARQPVVALRIVEPLAEPEVELEAMREVEEIMGPEPAPRVELFDQFAAELAEGVDDTPVDVAQPKPASPLDALLAPFVEAPHEVPMRRHMDPLPKPEASTPVTGEPGKILLAVGGEPVRYVDAEMEEALDLLARAAREEILAANAPAPDIDDDLPRKAVEGPWLAPIRKAWEPPADDEPEGKRWGFFRK